MRRHSLGMLGALLVAALTLGWLTTTVTEAQQAVGFYLIVQQTPLGPLCNILRAEQLTDQRAEFVEWRTGPQGDNRIRIYVHGGVSLSFVRFVEELAQAGVYLGVDINRCAR